MVSRALPLLRTLLLAALLLPAFAESFDERQAKTDMTNAEQVFDLARWCEQNSQPTKARSLYSQVIKIDPDHEGARKALGQVRVGERWVAKGLAPAAGKSASPAAEAANRPNAAGPGPAAKDVAWDLTIPKDPAGQIENPFLDDYVSRLPKLGNDSDAMSSAVATLIRSDNWPSAFPRLCKALLDPGYKDIYGSCDIIILLRKDNRMAEARRLFAFVVRGSEHVTDPEDLSYFLMLATGMHERKAVARMIELMDHADPRVKSAAAEAVAATIRLPVRDLTVDKAKAWWNANWSRDDGVVLMEQLRGADTAAALEAAAALCEMRNKDIFPVLFKLLRNPDPTVGRRAIDIVKRATTQDWSYDPGSPLDQRGKRVDLIEKWWKEEQGRFNWPGLPAIEDPTAAAPDAQQVDADHEAVGRLASVVGNQAQEAESALRVRGTKAIPALVGGLGHADPIARRRAYALLREISKQNIAYDPRAPEADRIKAIAAWKAWAVKAKLMVDEDATEDVK